VCHLFRSYELVPIDCGQRQASRPRNERYECYTVGRGGVSHQGHRRQGQDGTIGGCTELNRASVAILCSSQIRRSMVMEDGFKALEKIGSNIKDRVVVRYVNDFGEEEMGIDAGGLFKDFITDMAKRIFDPSYVRPV
jgi:hypothetical protein